MLETGVLALRLGGALHFVQLPAMWALWRAVQRYRLDVQVPEALRRILGVLGGGIVLAVFSGGVLALLLTPETFAGGFGFGFTLSWALFWAYRLTAQVFVYGPVIPLAGRWAHWLLSLVFVTKTLAYCVAAYCSFCWWMFAS